MTKEFWTSNAAAGYPETITLPTGKETQIGDMRRYHKGIADFLLEQGVIPENGEILDIGAGPASGVIFEDQLDRVTAVDVSPTLLAKNALPAHKKHILDVGTDAFPSEWSGKYTLAVAVFLHRYLGRSQSFHLASQVREALAPGGKFIIVDFPALGNAQMGRMMGEERFFTPDEETDILQTVGYRGVVSELVIFSPEYYRWPPPALFEVVGYI